MTLQNYLQLRNGTDVRGVASALLENEPVTLTEEAVENIAKAFCVWLISRTGKTRVNVAVGYDSRLSAATLCAAAVKGITQTGHNATVTGLSTTPSMFKLLKEETEVYHGSIMITASHLPANRNGMKFFFKTGALEAEDVKEILGYAANYRFSEGIIGEQSEKSHLDTYANGLVTMVREACGENAPLSGKKIIVDAGNGAGGFFAEKVLQPLGANTNGSQFLEPDGNFPNHIPNPENKEAMLSICEAVKKSDADFGIIFDTDVDRAAAVDKGGVILNRNRLIALVSALLLEEKPATIVTDSVTSDGLTSFIQTHGGKHHRFKRGYKNVINEAIRLNAEGEYTPLAIETSGHAAFLENDFLDDGAYLIVKLLIALAKAAKQGKTLSDLIETLPLPAEEREIRLRFKDGCDFKREGEQILKDFRAYAQKRSYITPAKKDYEGCRVHYDHKHGEGWALLRMSLHEPILPINIESNRPYGTIRIIKDLYAFLQKYDCIDSTPLSTTLEEYKKNLHCGWHALCRENPFFLLF